MKPGAELTKPFSRRHWTMRSRSPSAAFAWARILRAQRRAASCPWASIDAGPERAGHGKLSVLEGQLSRDKELAVKVQKGNVIRDGEGNLGKDEVQSLQPCFDLACHAVSYLRLYCSRLSQATIGQNFGLRKLGAGPLSCAPVGVKNPSAEAAVRPGTSGEERYGECGLETGACGFVSGDAWRRPGAAG